MNDGSTDGSGAICYCYAAEHDNITVIHQDNCGVSAARNTAVEYALNHGDHEQDWINFVDSDDFVHPKYLEYLHQAAKKSCTEISGCGYLRASEDKIDPNQIMDAQFRSFDMEHYWCKYCGNAIGATAKLFKLHLVQHIRFPVDKLFEDTYTTHRILFLCNRIAFTEVTLYYWYLNQNSITESSWTPKKLDMIAAAESQLSFLKENGFTRASKRSARYLVWSCIKALKNIRRLSPQYDYLLDQMKDRQNKALRLYAGEEGWITACCYWLMVRYVAPAGRTLKRKINKLFRH